MGDEKIKQIAKIIVSYRRAFDRMDAVHNEAVQAVQENRDDAEKVVNQFASMADNLCKEMDRDWEIFGIPDVFPPLLLEEISKVEKQERFAGTSRK